MSDEIIDYDSEHGFHIKKSKSPRDPNPEILTMESQGFMKEMTVHVCVCREMETTSFERPTRTIFYDLPLTYKVEGKDSREFYLKKETTRDPDDRFNKVFARVFIKDADTGSCQSAPMPNALFEQSSFPFLTVTRGKAKKITKTEIGELLKNGECLGIYDTSLTNRKIL